LAALFIGCAPTGVQVTFDGVGGGDITTTETTAGVTTSGTTSGGAY
jgi:hypothetical protein